MKTKELLIFLEQLKQLAKIQDTKLAYCLMKNGNNIRKYLNERRAKHNSKKVQEAYQKVEDERIKICEKYVEKDKEGKPILIDHPNGNGSKIYDLTEENNRLITKEFSEYKKNAPEMKIINKYEKSLADEGEQEAALGIFKFRGNIPSNLSVEQLEILEILLDDEGKKKLEELYDN